MSSSSDAVVLSVAAIAMFLLIFSAPIDFKDETHFEDNTFMEYNFITGFAVHPIYSGFSAAEAGFVVSGNSLSVTDDVVYKMGYYSINGTSWKSFTLTGAAYATSTVWLTGKTSYTLPNFGVGEHYVVIYSCKYNSAWDCHGNLWQLTVINNLPAPAANCGDGKCNGVETCSDCSKDCGACGTVLSDINVCSAAGYNCGTKLISGSNKNCGTCTGGLTCTNNLCVSASGKTIYVSFNGNDNTGEGSISKPYFTLNKAWSYVSAGDIIYMRGGTYRYGQTQSNLVDKSGTATKMISVWSYPGEKPIINYSDITPNKEITALNVENVKYLHLKGIRVTSLVQPTVGNLAEYGLKINDNTQNSIFELIETDHIGGWGVTIGQQGASSNNLFLNCDSHHNADPYTGSYNGEPYGWSDGFETASHGSTNITFRGCRAWSNSDDGWDLLRSDGLYILENCWSFWNGYKEDGVTPAGNGEGYKLLGPDTVGTTELRKIIRNSLAFENTNVGIAGNPGVAETNPQGIEMINDVSYHNGNGGIAIVWQNTKGTVRNTISYDNMGYDNTIRNYDFNGADVTHDHNSFDSNVKVDASDFLSLNSKGMDGPRQADGSLPVLNFLRLSPNSDLIDNGTNVGLKYNGKAPDIGAFER